MRHNKPSSRVLKGEKGFIMHITFFYQTYLTEGWSLRQSSLRVCRADS